MGPDNVLFILTDQQRTDTLGCYGNPVVRTPAIDGLAAAGTTFDACFTPTAICSPARASLLTGVRPFRHKMLANSERNVGYIDELPDSGELRSCGDNFHDWMATMLPVGPTDDATTLRERS